MFICILFAAIKLVAGSYAAIHGSHAAIRPNFLNYYWPSLSQEELLLPLDEEELPERLERLPHLRFRVVPASDIADAGASSTAGFVDEADAGEPIVAGKGGGGGGTTA